MALTIPRLLLVRPIIREIIDSIKNDTYHYLYINEDNGKMTIAIPFAHNSDEKLYINYDHELNSLCISEPEYIREIVIKGEHDEFNKLKHLDKFLDPAYYFQTSLTYDVKFTPDDIINLKQVYHHVVSTPGMKRFEQIKSRGY